MTDTEQDQGNYHIPVGGHGIKKKGWEPLLQMLTKEVIEKGNRDHEPSSFPSVSKVSGGSMTTAIFSDIAALLKRVMMMKKMTFRKL